MNFCFLKFSWGIEKYDVTNDVRFLNGRCEEKSLLADDLNEIFCFKRFSLNKKKW